MFRVGSHHSRHTPDHDRAEPQQQWARGKRTIPYGKARTLRLPRPNPAQSQCLGSAAADYSTTEAKCQGEPARVAGLLQSRFHCHYFALSPLSRTVRAEGTDRTEAMTVQSLWCGISALSEELAAALARAVTHLCLLPADEFAAERDEFYQGFVPGRERDILDVLADGIGLLAGWYYSREEAAVGDSHRAAGHS